MVTFFLELQKFLSPPGKNVVNKQRNPLGGWGWGDTWPGRNLRGRAKGTGTERVPVPALAPREIFCLLGARNLSPTPEPLVNRG